MTITIDGAAEHLNDHSRAFAPELMTKLREGLEMESVLSGRQSDGEYYVIENAEAGEMLQPYQGGFTPKGSVTHNEDTIRVRPIKMDAQFSETDLYTWWSKWNVSRFEAGRDPLSWTFPRYIYEKEILPKMTEELNTLAWLGVYAAPTTCTAGASIDSVDGLKKVIADLATASKIQVLASGAVTAATTREKVEAFVDLIPVLFRNIGGTILMSQTHFANYSRDYRNEFQHTPGMYSGNGVRDMVQVDGYNIFIKPVRTMEGSARWIFLPNRRDNAVWVSRTGFPIYPQITFDTAPRVLQMYATFYRGFGFEYPKEVFVSDQV